MTHSFFCEGSWSITQTFSTLRFDFSEYLISLNTSASSVVDDIFLARRSVLVEIVRECLGSEDQDASTWATQIGNISVRPGGARSIGA